MLRRLATIVPVLMLAGAAQAQTFKVIGQAGVLGEWELAGDIVETTTAGKQEFAGPLTMTHTGLCTQDGPPVKAVQMRLQLDAKASRLDATLLIDGVACTYSATKSDAYNGQLRCADDRREVPLLLWLR
jgi:hypothetical protein